MIYCPRYNKENRLDDEIIVYTGCLKKNETVTLIGAYTHQTHNKFKSASFCIQLAQFDFDH